MNRYVDIRCPKCGGKNNIIFVYSLGWAVRKVEAFDRVNGEIEFSDHGNYDSVDMTKENTPFGAPPPSHLVHYEDCDQKTVCHRWTEDEEIESHKSFELAIYKELRPVIGIDKTVSLLGRHGLVLRAWEERGVTAKKAVLRMMAIEMGLSPEEV